MYPPKPPKVIVPEWSTYIESRNPQFKLHKNLGHAKNAIWGRDFARGGILYRYVDDDWKIIEEVKHGSHQLQSNLMYEPYLRKTIKRLRTSGYNAKYYMELYPDQLEAAILRRLPQVQTEYITDIASMIDASAEGCKLEIDPSKVVEWATLNDHLRYEEGLYKLAPSAYEHRWDYFGTY